MNIRGLLKHRNALYGLLAIWIVCFHVSISVRFPTSSYTISHFIKATLKQSDVPFNGLLKLFSQFLSSGNLAVDVSDADDITVGDIAVFLGDEGVSVSDIMRRNNVSYVHSEWFSMTAGRLEKVYVC